eukprot:TRINITY_DN1953_c0_g1_i1.p1 TRINITY_DN1953_c0_g1~~TRINITY_DN1953_c0_g1_i1.p1  ORF type:complete len:382 (-),score=116.67 TRINITY_DN1953_c0_g1_i1:74-1219(-)
MDFNWDNIDMTDMNSFLAFETVQTFSPSDEYFNSNYGEVNYEDSAPNSYDYNYNQSDENMTMSNELQQDIYNSFQAMEYSLYEQNRGDFGNNSFYQNSKVKMEPKRYNNNQYQDMMNIQQNQYCNQKQIKSEQKMEPEDELSIYLLKQPSREIRTRTPSENRTFTIEGKITGDFLEIDIYAISVKLQYSNCKTTSIPPQKILGGNKIVPVQEDGSFIFDNLCMCEASTKHEEKEFCLQFIFVKSDSTEIETQHSTTPFYAYSHKKVLTRRKNINLRALSSSYGPMSGGGEIHVVGTPFIKGPALRIIFRTPHGEIILKYEDEDVERYSETVMFFELPPYPRPEFNSMLPEGTEIKTEVVVTNDGKHYSPPLEFIYYASKSR